MDIYDKVSIIVPIYKVEKYLDDCISSLVNQTYDNLEIILVDDGSPDNCPAICDAWAQKDSRIKVIHKENGGLCDARNIGIHHATGKWLLFIDSDDIIPVNFIEALIEASSDEQHLVVSSKARFTIDLPLYEWKKTIPQHFGKNMVSARGGLYCWGALYSRELVSKINLEFDTSLRNIEDVVWNGIYLRYITDIVYVDIPYFYRINPTSITSKCGNYQWQIASWLAARRSIMNWFKDKDLTRTQRKEIIGMYRHCQNNIYAECVAGNIPYSTFVELEKHERASFYDSFIPFLERNVRKYLPRLYYEVYIFMLRVKNTIRR